MVRSDARLSDIGEHVYATLGAEPTVFVVEDLHWVDEASAEVLRFLARRVESAPLVMVLTYRDDEIGLRHPARGLLGDFAGLDGLTTVQLAPLSVGGGRRRGGRHRTGPLAGARRHRRQRVLRLPGRQGAGPSTAALGAGTRCWPGSRTSRPGRPRGAAADRLRARPARRPGAALVDVDLPTLRRLDETALLARDEHGLVFRHELARLAVESTIPPGGTTGLHLRLLDALERLDIGDPAVLTHHAVAARDSRRATAYAQAAAAEATATASNAEAAAFLEIALEHLPGTATRRSSARVLLLQLSLQQYLTSRISEAIGSRAREHPARGGRRA